MVGPRLLRSDGYPNFVGLLTVHRNLEGTFKAAGRFYGPLPWKAATRISVRDVSTLELAVGTSLLFTGWASTLGVVAVRAGLLLWVVHRATRMAREASPQM